MTKRLSGTAIAALLVLMGVRALLATRTDGFTVDEPWGLADTVRAGMEGRGVPFILLGQRYRDRGPFYAWPVVVFAKLPPGLSLLALSGIATLALFAVPQAWRLPLAAVVILLFARVVLLRRDPAAVQRPLRVPESE